MKTPIHLRALRVGHWLGMRRVPLIPTLITFAFWGNWQCRVFGHRLIPNLPFCWRCNAEWTSWTDVPKETKA